MTLGKVYESRMTFYSKNGHIHSSPKEDIYCNEVPGLAIEPRRCYYGAFYMQIPCGRNYFVKKDGAERLLCRDKSLHLHLLY